MTERSGAERRRVPRGGRRALDRPGRYPPILVAESSDGVRRACTRYLEQLNFAVAEAADGEQALSAIVASAPQLILTEWDLPAMPAAKLAQWVAQRRPGSGIPMIVLANTPEVDGAPLRVAGLLRKPFSPAHMIDEVRRVLRATSP